MRRVVDLSIQSASVRFKAVKLVVSLYVETLRSTGSEFMRIC
jgi:hypothetical protein